MLTNFPLDCLHPLRDPLDADFVRTPMIEYDGACMNSVFTVLNYVSNVLDNVRLCNLLPSYLNVFNKIPTMALR